MPIIGGRVGFIALLPWIWISMDKSMDISMDKSMDISMDISMCGYQI